jgi:hypothetical protein
MVRKAKIAKALREQVWINHIGKKFETSCMVPWCSNKINVFDFHCGHNIPESCGGTTDISNLVPICSRCNLSMGNKNTIDQWIQKSKPPSKWIFWIRRIFPLLQWRSYDSKENGIKLFQNPTSLKSKRSK